MGPEIEKVFRSRKKNGLEPLLMIRRKVVSRERASLAFGDVFAREEG